MEEKKTYAVGINHDFLVQFIRVQSLFPIFNQPCIFWFLSTRGVSQSTTKILVEKGTVPGEEGVHTKNIVYKEVLLPVS